MRTEYLTGIWIAAVAALAHPFSARAVSVWPQPKSLTNGTTVLPVHPSPAFFASVGHSSDVLLSGIERYTQILARIPSGPPSSPLKRQGPTVAVVSSRGRGPASAAALTRCSLNVTTAAVNLELGVDESYVLEITRDAVCTATAATPFGMLRALETLSQLVDPDWSGSWFLRGAPVVVDDAPRFPHRGLLIDSARHFLPLETILAQVDAMASNKLNTLHWHIVDDQSFPFVSTTFPQLSGRGAYDPARAVYTPDEVDMVIEFARLRGVRVVPEFDMPGHTSGFLQGLPSLRGSGSCNFDPTLDATYATIEEFLSEVVTRFPDAYVHLGGDEVNFACWTSSAKITAFAKEHGITDLQAYFERRIGDEVLPRVRARTGRPAIPIFWQEVFQNRVNNSNLAPESVIEVWEGSNDTVLIDTLANGYRGVFAGPWYLDHLGDTWDVLYSRPIDSGIPEQNMHLLLGGEACMWGEKVDGENAISRTWPRGSAPAEIFWSDASFKKDPSAAAPRLHRFVCKQRLRGIGMDPIGVNWGFSWCDWPTAN